MKKIIVALLIIAGFGGCSKSKDTTNTTCNYDPCAFVVPAGEIQMVKKYLDSTGVVAMQHCSGMFYTITTPGTGKQPTACSNVTVLYKGQLTNGKVFDQSIDPNSPASFNLESLIGGWKDGVPLIKEGGSIRLYIPPSLGYGSTDVKDNTGAVIIPANSVLIFDIALGAVY